MGVFITLSSFFDRVKMRIKPVFVRNFIGSREEFSKVTLLLHPYYVSVTTKQVKYDILYTLHDRLDMKKLDRYH